MLNTTLLKNLDAFLGDNRTSVEVELVRLPLLLNRTLEHLPFDLSTNRVGRVRTIELYRTSPIQASVQLRNPKWAEEKFEVRVVAPTSG